MQPGIQQRVTSGKECLPYRVTLGDFIRFCHENSGELHKYEGLMAGAYGPCRLGKYVLEQNCSKGAGFDLTVRNPYPTMPTEI